MKFLIEKVALLKALGHVQSVVERRNTIPILSNIKLSVVGNTLTMQSTDMDIELVAYRPVEGVHDGEATMPAHTFYEIARKLPDGSVLEIDGTGGGDHVELRCGKARFLLSCLPVADFPLLTNENFPASLDISGAELRSLIDRTQFAISTEETRYYLNGIYFHIENHDNGIVLRAVATDGHRLARAEVPVSVTIEDFPGIIVPRKTINEVRKLIDDSSETVSVQLSEQKIRFSTDALILTSKLIDGVFPDYERVIPKGNDKTLEVNRKDLYDAVDRVSAISTERSRAVKLAIGDKTLVLSTVSPDTGTATEELLLDDYVGGDLDIGFNSRYLLDIVKQIEGEKVRMELSDAASPTILRDPKEGTNDIYVLMPMRV